MHVRMCVFNSFVSVMRNLACNTAICVQTMCCVSVRHLLLIASAYAMLQCACRIYATHMYQSTSPATPMQASSGMKVITLV